MNLIAHVDIKKLQHGTSSDLKTTRPEVTLKPVEAIRVARPRRCIDFSFQTTVNAGPSCPLLASVWHSTCQVSSTQEEERRRYHALGICDFYSNAHLLFQHVHDNSQRDNEHIYDDDDDRKIQTVMTGPMAAGRKALLWVHSPSVQFSASSLFPSHILPLCLGAGELHSRRRCLSHWLLQMVHSLHSSQPPSTATRRRVNVKPDS